MADPVTAKPQGALRDLRVGEDLRPGELPEDAVDFLRLLGGPTLLRLPGRDRSRCRVASTLLHGNEPSGLRAMLRYLREEHLPAVDALLFVGAVGTALARPVFGHRALPGERDFNRCWRPPWEGELGALSREVLARIHAASPECLVDLHNNTGHNPVYGVSFKVGHAELSLVSLFGERIVHTPIELGTLVEATVDAFPSVTVECGRAGDPAADQAAYRGLCHYLDWDVIDFEKPRGPVTLFEAPVRVEVRAGVELAFGDRMQPEAQVTISNDIDRHNFENLAPGTAFGWIREGLHWPFEARTPQGEDRSRELLAVEDGVLRARRSFVPIMMTTDRRIALSDCLFYAVQPARSGW
ncbi:MAG: hypothetical protein ACQGVC_13315 [Myxococcota bacterium]